MILETFFLTEEKHAYNGLSLQDHCPPALVAG
jgi:hypothetical protein